MTNLEIALTFFAAIPIVLILDGFWKDRKRPWWRERKSGDYINLTRKWW